MYSKIGVYSKIEVPILAKKLKNGLGNPSYIVFMPQFFWTVWLTKTSKIVIFSIFMQPFFGKWKLKELFLENLTISSKNVEKINIFGENLLKKYSKIEVIYEIKISLQKVQTAMRHPVYVCSLLTVQGSIFQCKNPPLI